MQPFLVVQLAILLHALEAAKKGGDAAFDTRIAGECPTFEFEILHTSIPRSLSACMSVQAMQNIQPFRLAFTVLSDVFQVLVGELKVLIERQTAERRAFGFRFRFRLRPDRKVERQRRSARRIKPANELSE